ncbi:hypothetical protein MNV49_006197 [Pseudohyphozyma bogoriensis]|nr:hypothetical protein MNV49_006197 [Pseudohyphozyma bogoriensis]
MSTKPFELRWGILSAGWIAGEFAKEALIDPATREVFDVSHRIAAVFSRDVKKADHFIDQFLSKQPGPRAAAYGQIEAMLADPNVDAVYIASPNTFHYEHAKMCIEAGKATLLEKPATINAEQAKILFALAEKHKVFLMEADWTHFMPASLEVRKVIDSGVLGDIKHVNSSYWLDLQIDKLDLADRSLDPKFGPYAWNWIFLTLYRDRYGPIENLKGPLPLPKIVSSVTMMTYADPARPSGQVDESTVSVLTFPPKEAGKPATTATMHTSFVLTPPDGMPCATILGTKGKLTINFPSPRPSKITVETHDLKQNLPAIVWFKDNVKHEVQDFGSPGGCRGFVFEMDHVARNVRDEKWESDVIPGRVTILSMSIFDEIRRQGGLEFPPEIEVF